MDVQQFLTVLTQKKVVGKDGLTVKQALSMLANPLIEVPFVAFCAIMLFLILTLISALLQRF